jgi:acyl-coenzyme A thioesterase PaaI-like protein
MTSVEDARHRAIDAVSRTRAHGMHLLGHFAGIEGEAAPGGSARLSLRARGEPATSLVAYCAFADLVLGSAIRSVVGAGARLGTVTLNLQHRLPSASGVIIGSGVAAPPQEGFGTAHATYCCGDDVVGFGQASAMALPAPPGREPPLLPWERQALAPLAPAAADLDQREAAFVADVEAAAHRARNNGTTIEDEFLSFRWESALAGEARGSAAIGPTISNRVGHVQGGVLYAAGAFGSAEALGASAWEIAGGTYQFLRPAEGLSLTVAARTERVGRSLAFTSARLDVDGLVVGLGSYTFRRTGSSSTEPLVVRGCDRA